MKTVRFLLPIVGFGALSLGLGFAEPSGPARERAPSERPLEGKHFEQKPGESHASGMSNQNKGTKTTAKGHSGPKLPQLFQPNGGHPGEKRTNSAQTKGTSANAPGLHQPGLNKFAGGVKAGSMINEMENRRRLPVAGLSGTPPPNQLVHRRGPAPPLIGGPTLLTARNTAVINGTGMKHKL
jgi:hypothetical protein